MARFIATGSPFAVATRLDGTTIEVNEVFRYSTSYLHMIGVFPPGSTANHAVLPMEFVAIAQNLGQMNDTGVNSFFSHLHFSVWDASGGTFAAEIPSPLDGVVLGPADEGTCVLSQNS